jgi:hypothetical protein
MALLTDQRKVQAWVEVMQQIANNPAVVPADLLDKDSVLAAIEYTDAFVEAQTPAFNAGLPEPFKSTASAKLKGQLFAIVLYKRLV